MKTRAGQVVRKEFRTRVKQAGERRRTFTISTKSVDRDGDRIQFWRLDEYRRNPVVLYAHDNRDLPIARAVSVQERGNRLLSTAEFATSAFASTVLDLVDEGMLNAASIGFIPREPIERNQHGGFDMGAELLEWSVVPVPANPGALVERAKRAGIDPGPILHERERHLRRCAGPECGGGEEFDVVEALASLTPGQARELLREPIEEAVWRQLVTPRTGRLGP